MFRVSKAEERLSMIVTIDGELSGDRIEVVESLLASGVYTSYLVRALNPSGKEPLSSSNAGGAGGKNSCSEY